MANKRPDYPTKLEIIFKEEGISRDNLRVSIIEVLDEVNNKLPEKEKLSPPSEDTIYYILTGKRVNRMLLTYKKILIGLNNITNNKRRKRRKRRIYTLDDIVNFELLTHWGS